MYYFLCEGKLNCIEYTSIKNIIEEFGYGISYKQIALEEVKNIEFIFNTVVLKSDVKDTIILLLNNISDCSFLGNLTLIAKEKGVKFGCTDYSSFEDLILSCEGLFYWVIKSIIQ